MVPSLRAQFMIREVDAARVVDVPARELCAAVGMDLAAIDDPLAMVSLRQIAAVYVEAARRVGDSALGLHVGERCGTSIVDLVNYAIISRPTLAKAYDDLKPFVSRLYPEGDLTLAVHGGIAAFTYRIDPAEAEINRHRCEALIANVVKLARYAIGREEPVHYVGFQHARPEDISEHVRIFRGPIRFGWPVHEIQFSARWLGVPLATADANLCAVLDRYLGDLSARTPRARSFAHDVRLRLLHLLPSSGVNLSLLAKDLGTSERTMQRRLAEEGTSLQRLIEESRHELSVTLLRNSNLSLAEIARRLGYAAPTSFTRAFRRWRGISPAAHRKEERSPGEP
jgi:AraC-like DNA-binding protein